MKKANLITALILCFISFRSYAQNGSPFTVDFSDQKNLYELPARYNEKFNIKIINLNRNLYKIEGVKTETDFNIAVPGILSAVKFPAFANFKIPESGEYLPSDKGKSSNMLVGIQYLLDNLPLNKLLLFNNELLRLSKDCDKEEEIRKSVVAAGDKFSRQNGGDRNAGPQAVIKAIEAKLATLIKDTESDLKELTKLTDEYQAQATKEFLTEEQVAALKSQKAIVEEKRKELLKFNLSPDKRKAAESALKESQKFVSDHEERLLEIKTTAQTIKDNLKKATETLDELNKAIKEDRPYAILKLFKQLIHPNTYTFLSEDINPKTDEIKYTITIEPTELNACATGSKRIIVLLIKVRGGVKLDFSTGVFMSGGNNRFLGNSYYYRNIDASSREIIAADRSSRYMLSIGALMHIYKRSEKPVKLAGSLGVSSTVSLTDLNLHAGPSLLIGSKNRLVISTGLTLKSAPILDQKLTPDKPYTKLESPDAIPTVSVFPLAGYFFGISYNISKFTSSK